MQTNYVNKAIAAVTGADQVLVAAGGAGTQIWVYGIQFTSALAGTAAIQDADDTAITGIFNYPANGGICIPPSGDFNMPLFKVATNKALEIDVVTGTINGSLQYAIVNV
jgi:hypothetical protein